MTDARVILWGSQIGAVSWIPERDIGVFQYDPDFVNSGIQLSPITMPLKDMPYAFPALNRETFWGLPGLLADSLPDKFGNAVLNAWLASEGRAVETFNPVERLCYVGTRGMGGLEFQPAVLNDPSFAKTLDVVKLLDLSNRILNQRSTLNGVLNGEDDREAMQDILRVGTSAGGARAKAILAWNPETNEFRSGQVLHSPGFEPWILKFDGIRNNRDKELSDPLGYGKIEFAYYRMALAAGINMMESRLHQEGGRSHFMTRRFDRTSRGEKIHMQTLGALTHADYNQPAGYSYEEALLLMKRLGLPKEDLEQQVLRTFFNVVGRNQDDHVKNISFLMSRNGIWRLSPAYDITYAYAPSGAWTGQHQMSINGKRDHFTRADLFHLANLAGFKDNRILDLLGRVLSVIAQWPEFAAEAGVEAQRIRQIQGTHRLNFK